jgi:hypothetical protein
MSALLYGLIISLAAPRPAQRAAAGDYVFTGGWKDSHLDTDLRGFTPLESKLAPACDKPIAFTGVNW